MDQLEAIYKVKQKIEKGDNTDARTLLREIIKNDPNNEVAWWLGARVSETKEQAIYCLGRVVKINPDNAQAQRQLEKLKRKQTTRSVPSVISQQPELIGKPSTGGFSSKLVIWSGLGILILCIVLVSLFMITKFLPAKNQVANNVLPTTTATVLQSTPTLTINPTDTAIPSLTPTSITVFSGSPKSYLPSDGDMPTGFIVSPQGSGPVSVNDGDGYILQYMNDANAINTRGEVSIIIYTLYVFNSQDKAQAFFNNTISELTLDSIASEISTSTTEPIQFRSIRAEIYNSDQAESFAGYFLFETFLPQYLSYSSFRKDNIVTTMLMMLPETGATDSVISRQVEYYSSLVSDKLSK